MEGGIPTTKPQGVDVANGQEVTRNAQAYPDEECRSARAANREGMDHVHEVIHNAQADPCEDCRSARAAHRRSDAAAAAIAAQEVVCRWIRKREAKIRATSQQ